MKIVRILDQSETRVVSELLNQMILRELVMSEHSVTSLARRLDSPPLKLWRRIQKLESMKLVGVSRTLKSGNIETKMYRATATSFIPRHFLDFKPRDSRVSEAFKIYSGIQGEITALLSSSNEIPPDVDPVDYSIYARMWAFARVCGEPETHEKILELRERLSAFGDPARVAPAS